MSEATPSVDGGLSPAKRKRLQQAFEAANLQMRQENYDYATELFTQCVLGDPANAIYTQGFLANLKQKYKNNKKGKPLGFFSTTGSKGMAKKAHVQKDWAGVLKYGVEVLKVNPWDIATLKMIASACDEMDCGESQLHYLKVALEPDPNNIEINKLCAKALHKRRLLDQAIACWHRVEKAKPGDEEAARAISSLTVERTLQQGNYSGDDKKGGKGAGGGGGDATDLTPEENLKRDIRRNPKDLSKYKQLADLYIREEMFDQAVEWYRKALQIDKGNVDLIEALEDVELRQVRAALSEAEKQAATGAPADRARFEEAKRAVAAKELEMAKNRVERYPNNLQYRFNLGRQYHHMGMYNEAIVEFQASRNDPKYRGQCTLNLGVCFQKIKKYPLAMNHFREAVEEIPDRDTENKKRALYMAGKLAVFLRDIDGGEKFLSTLAGMDFNYKDVSSLLDKIDELRKNGGGAGGDSTPA